MRKFIPNFESTFTSVFMQKGNYKYVRDIATRFGFGEGLVAAAASNDKIIALGSDITASVGMQIFKDAFPERFYSLGIAEQNAVAVAAGMALSGMIPVFSTYGVFSAMRALDQIRISLCYNNLHAIIGGAHAGISVGPDGATHQALEDIAVMRVLPNMTLLSPCDYTQTKILTQKAAERKDSGPVYIRYGREPMPDFTSPRQNIEIGKAQLLKEGSHISIMATGHLVWESLVAADELAKRGISAEVINIHTIKPIDTEAVIASARKTGAVLTAEEHQISGGLGSAVAEVLAKAFPVRMDFVGMNDSFGESGQPRELMDKYGMNARTIVEKALNLLK